MSHFDFLSGGVYIHCECPPHLRDGLGPFYQDPNSDKWPSPYARILYHESIHFWQVLSSGYVANLVAQEWIRFQTFQSTGEVAPPAESVARFDNPDGGEFTARQVVECWARFWDVHTRDPAQVIREEGLSEIFAAADHHDAFGPARGRQGYSGSEWDFVMQHGVEQSNYEAPYRWMLERLRAGRAADALLRERNVAGDEALLRGVASYLAVLTFPAIVHGAFASPSPLDVFAACVDRLADETRLARVSFAHKKGRIDFDWLNSWTFVHGELIHPVLRDLDMPNFTSGFDVIARGPLSMHPVYAAYLKRWHLLTLMRRLDQAALEKSVAEGDTHDLSYRFALAHLSTEHPWAVFAQPGQPTYRARLGTAMSPPIVQFADHALFPVFNLGQQPDANLTRRVDQTVSGWPEVMQDLSRDLDRFRRAEYAVSRGLPPDAFEQSRAAASAAR